MVGVVFQEKETKGDIKLWIMQEVEIKLIVWKNLEQMKWFKTQNKIFTKK